MTERRASTTDKVYRGDVVKYIRNNISLGTFMKRTIKTADEACWDLCNKLNFVPAVKEEPERQTGEWIDAYYPALPLEGGIYRCSVCGGGGCESYWNYCPHCGSLNGKVEGE